jgi:hypothetical protein
VLVDLVEGARVMAHGTPGLAIGDVVTAGSRLFGATKLKVFHSVQPETPDLTSTSP